MSKKITRKDFDEIYEETYKIVLKFTIVKCNNIDDINDIIQDTYLELLKILKKKKILEIENTKNYILGIENNIIKRYYKKVKKENIVILNMYDEEDNNLEIKDEFDLEANIINKDIIVKEINDINCCGLGGCAIVNEKEIASGFIEKLKSKRLNNLYVYCATCAGNFNRNEINNVKHLLLSMLGIDNLEIKNKSSIINRAMFKFY